jgi:hypothetical protein
MCRLRSPENRLLANHPRPARLIGGVRTWRFEAAKDSDGKFVPVRVPVQITFKMHWQIR